MGEQILIKDGVKYRLMHPEPEPTKFEPMIKEHVKDVFGPTCRYFAKREMKSLAGNRSIPDGFVIDFEKGKWYIVELKLLGEDAIRRIAGQIVNYKTAVRNPRTQKDIRTAIRKEIENIDYREKADIAHYCEDVSTFLELIYDKTPEIVVIIDNMAGEDGKRMEESVHGADPNAKIVAFKTFVREGTEEAPKPVYAHLFEPLYTQKPTGEIPKPPVKVSGERKEYPEKERLAGISDEIKELYEKVKSSLLAISPDIRIRPTKYYIGFISKTNFADIRIQEKALKIWLNMSKGELDDPKSVFRDVLNIGHWGNGDYELKIKDDKNIKYILSLAEQSYRKNSK